MLSLFGISTLFFECESIYRIYHAIPMFAAAEDGQHNTNCYYENVVICTSGYRALEDRRASQVPLTVRLNK